MEGLEEGLHMGSNTDFWPWHDGCTLEFIAAVITYTRAAQERVYHCQCLVIEQESAHCSLSFPKDLYVVNGC